jgi:molecular chaperone HtpG
MPEQKYYKLTNEQCNGISWMDWYVGEIPKVEYSLNGKTLKPTLTISPTKNRFFTPQSKEYGKIRWEYLEEWKYKTNVLLACNDIIITLSYPNYRFKVSDIDDIDNYAIGKYVVIDKPCLFVEDTKGNFPLKLDRNGLDIDKLPFEDDLLIDLSKDFIAQLLMAPISKNIHTKPVFSPHKTDFLYLVSGFVFASDFFINKLNTLHKFLKIELYDSEDVFKYKSIILCDLYEYVLVPYYYNTSEYIRILDDGGVCLFSKDYRMPRGDNEFSYHYYSPESYPVKRNTKIYDYFIDRSNLYKIKWIDENYFIVANKLNTTNKIQSNTLDINRWLSIIQKMKDKVILIEEIPLQYVEPYTHRGGKILNDLFEEYLGSDVVIPYDMEKRIEKYPKAFNELKDYMKDYEKDLKNL